MASAPQTTITDREWIPGLDGLRAIAVLAVVLFHFFDAPRGGWLGVELFFALSGYLITSTVLHDIHTYSGGRFEPSDATRFYWARAFRILPALFEICLLYGAIRVFDPTRVTHFSENLSSVLLFYSNWTRALGLPYPDYLGHTWSLAIEEQFYVLWPLVLFLFLRKTGGERRLAWTLGAAAAGVTLHRYLMATATVNIDNIYNRTDTRADTILLGCCAALVARGEGFRAWAKSHHGFCLSLATASALCLGWLFAVMDWQDLWYYRWGHVLFSVSSTVVVAYVWLFPGGRATAWLNWWPLAYVGRRSYGFYLFHYLVFYFMLQHGWKYPLGGTALAFGLAILSWRFVESPALRFKKRRFARAS